jgi:RNA polymerase sigma-70 factor (ECF subfamily)
MSDEQLVKAVIDGDRSSIDLLVSRYYKIVYAYIYKLTGDYHMSYDLTQEVFIKGIRAIKKYKHEDKLKSWMLTIASNLVKDYFRRQKRQKIDWCDNYIDIKEENNIDTSMEALLQQEDNKSIRVLIDTLSLEMKEVIILRYFYDMKISEIAKITSTKEATVKTRLRRALKNLNKKLLGGTINEKEVIPLK